MKRIRHRLCSVATIQSKLPQSWHDPGRRGAMMVLIAVSLPLFVMMAAFAVDTAYMQLTRTELRVATDAAARAGGRRLSINQDTGDARREARRAAGRNQVAGSRLLLANRNIEFGYSERANVNSRYVFDTSNPEINAIRINGKRTAGSRSGPINLFFAGALGARTFEPSHSAVSTQIDRDISLALDRSGSMAYASDESSWRWRPAAAPPGWGWGDPVPPNSRWLDLVNAVNGFLVELENTPQDEYVSLATFSSSARLDEGMTLNYNDIRTSVDGITQQFNGGATNIGQGMQESIDVLTDGSRPFAARTIVIMTDGIWNRGPNPITIAQQARAQGITVHAVTFSGEADQNTMRQVAEAGGGKYWHAPTGAALLAVFREIANNNPTLLTD